MYVPSVKITALIEFWGKQRNIPAKSHLRKFVDENDLNYIQWNAYSNGSQNAGIKILGVLMSIFPDLNLNWVFKDAYGMFISEVLPEVDEPKVYTRDQLDHLTEQVNNLKNRLLEIHKLSKTDTILQ